MPTRRDFLKAAPLLAAAPLAARAAEGDRPDVLFIAIEDASPHRFGCYGNTVCKTPHIDHFAETAVRFGDCHTNPPCCPSRTALLLGLRPGTTNVHGNRDDWRELVPDAVTMPAHFRRNGYETIRCGKMFHGGAGKGAFEDDQTWDRVINPNDGFGVAAKRRAPEGPGADPEFARAAGSPFVYGPTGRDDLDEVDGRVAQQGIRVLQARRDIDKPMLLALGLHAPHLPFCAPDKYHAMYPPEEMEIPRNPDAGPDGLPVGRELPKANPYTLDQWRKAISGHYATISFIDAQIGRILQALDDTGRANSTTVVIWTDHGFMLGEQWKWRKGPLRDLSTGCLLIWRAPGVSQTGGVCERPVETIDIFPTMFDLCGVPQPEGIEAISMKPLLEDPEALWKEGALMWAGRNRSIVTEKWRYCEYRNGRRELFDRNNDPGEFTNLAEDPGHADTVAELSGLIAGGWQACLPDR